MVNSIYEVLATSTIRVIEEKETTADEGFRKELERAMKIVQPATSSNSGQSYGEKEDTSAAQVAYQKGWRMSAIMLNTLTTNIE